MVDPPKILISIINRFDPLSSTIKNSDNIIIDNEVYINSQTFELIGFISHLGNSTQFGHYTSNIIFSNESYSCNDLKVCRISDHTYISENVYIAIYRCTDTEP